MAKKLMKKRGIDVPAHFVIWRFLDGKPGHENQTLGLINALSSLASLKVCTLSCSVTSPWKLLLYWLQGCYPPGDDLPNPHLLVGAGHSTHMPMLAARKRWGGRIVVLMKPSLPLRFFNLCIIPEHDNVSTDTAATILTTRGVLNRITPSQNKDANRGLILIGGPSSHHGWDDNRMVTQLQQIFNRNKESSFRWVLSTSRRTPASFLQYLQKNSLPKNLEIVSWTEIDGEWLPAQLGRASKVWVSQDSVSMVYETLTSGAACGLLSVPAKRNSRITKGLETLVINGLVTPFELWQTGKPLSVAQSEFNETARCAHWIYEQWMKSH